MLAALGSVAIAVSAMTLNADDHAVGADRAVPALAAEPPMLGIHWARGAQPPGQASSNPNMTWHGGAVMNDAKVTSIFWGPSWGTYSGDKVTGMDSWYLGVGGSPYAQTSDEYTGTNSQVTTAITFALHLVDTSSVPKTVSKLTTRTLNEVCKVITNPTLDGYYPVYVDRPRGSAQFCAYHSYGTCNGVPIQFAFFFNLDNDPGCDPQDSSNLHSEGLAALANVSGHELSEARTDPQNGGWYDSSKQENGDKCAWSFGSPLLAFPNNTSWKIQGNWSNTAYTNSNNGMSYPNLSGQAGCIDGSTSYPAVAP